MKAVHCPDTRAKYQAAVQPQIWFGRFSESLSMICAALCLCVVVFPSFAAEAGQDLASLENQANQAAAAGDYGTAASLLRKARSLWPSDSRIPLLLGDLYTDRELHSLALDEYLAAEALTPQNPEVLQRIADAYGFLNREEDSIRYLRRILDQDPGNLRAVNDLGWMLFKTHKLQEGVGLLEDAEQKMGPDIEFSMTLGTLHSELFEYKEAKRRYIEAITDARAQGYFRFASVAYYNLSLLESRFRFWREALDTANDSIRMEARPSGYLARGELRLKRMELGAAREDFLSAYALDTTPLARLSLAEAAQISGRLDEALTWALEVSKLQEHPWMANFGTDPESFSLDLHELLSDIFRGRAEQERVRPKRNLADWALSLVRRGADRLKAAYHERLYRKIARAISLSYRKEGARLPAATHGYSAFRPYPWLARRYLREARAFEVSHVPESRASYDLEEAMLRGDSKDLAETLEALDPIWERDLLAEGLGELAKISGRTLARRSALERLWLINPGALPQQGFSVPALVSLEAAPGVFAASRQSLVRRLRRLGMGMEGDRDDAFAFSLELKADSTGAEYVLKSRVAGAVLKKGRFSFDGSGSPAAELSGFLFRNLNETSL
jgi:tetratricopeptide (TPR) repeat protein